jgi:hypothetical protein
MKIPHRFFSVVVVVCLVSALSPRVSALAQSNPASPLMQGPTMAGPRQPSVAPSSRMAPTGLATNGGSIANGVYTNVIYGFSLKLPPGWAVVPAPDAKPTPPALGQPPTISHQLNRALLVVTENAPMKQSSQRKSIQIVATKLVVVPGPGSAQGYLVYSQKTAKEKDLPVEYQGDPRPVKINGQELWTVALTQTTDGVVQHVEQFVITQNSTLLQFLVVSPNEAGLKEIEPSIQSLQFKPASTPARKKRAAKAQVPAKKD